MRKLVKGGKVCFHGHNHGNQLTVSVRYVILDKSGGCIGSRERKGKCFFTPTFMCFIADGV